MLLPIGAYPRCTRASELFMVVLSATSPDWCGSEGVEACTRGCGYERVHGPIECFLDEPLRVDADDFVVSDCADRFVTLRVGGDPDELGHGVAGLVVAQGRVGLLPPVSADAPRGSGLA
jgi:hypothetical protein